MSDEEFDPYLEVARRYLNETIELIIRMHTEGSVDPKVQQKERVKYEKEVQKWRDANEVLKRTAQALVKDNDRLEEEVGRLEAENTELKREINEQLMRQTDVVRKLHDYPLDQHMTQEAFARWKDDLKLLEQLMKETPTRRGD